MQKFLENKKLAAMLSIVSNSFLIVLKLIAGFVSGSISVISEAIHSFSDLLASMIAFFSVSKSEQPADSDHQFGHGKYEDLSGLIEGFLIVLAAVYIVYESVKKIILGPEELSYTKIAMLVMLFSVVVNIFVSTYIFKVAKNTDSMALFADAEHLKTDVYSSLAVFLGLLAIHFTGLTILDPVIAIIVAVIIFIAGVSICKKSADNLLDTSLPQKDIENIKTILQNDIGITSIKEIKTRKSGKDKEIVITITVYGETTVNYAHKLCDELESAIEKKLGNTSVTIHAEPYEQ